MAQIQEAANVLLQGTFRQSTATATTEGEEEVGTVAADDDGGAKRIHRILLIGYSYGSILCASASSRITACIGCIWIAPVELLSRRRIAVLLCVADGVVDPIHS